MLRSVLRSAVSPLRSFPRPIQAVRWHGSKSGDIPDEEAVNVTFVDGEGNRKEVRGRVGDTVLELAHANEIDLEGACEGSLACSTCHVVLTDEFFEKLEEPTDEENDMLDLAFGLTDTSRLGCQIILGKDLEGMVLTIPAATANFYVDGHKPKPH